MRSITSKTNLHKKFPCLMRSLITGNVVLARVNDRQGYHLTIVSGEDLGKSWAASKTTLSDNYEYLPEGFSVTLINSDEKTDDEAV